MIILSENGIFVCLKNDRLFHNECVIHVFVAVMVGLLRRFVVVNDQLSLKLAAAVLAKFS